VKRRDAGDPCDPDRPSLSGAEVPEIGPGLHHDVASYAKTGLTRPISRTVVSRLRPLDSSQRFAGHLRRNPVQLAVNCQKAPLLDVGGGEVSHPCTQ
jgi:hypothetical protein